MAEINTDHKPKGEQNKGIVKKGKKLSTKVDMTPVVDLAFLLLTFFMLATTFIKPQVMQLILPEKNQENLNQPKVNEKNVLSIVLDGDNKIYWYVGLTNAVVNKTDYTDAGLRKVLREQTKDNDKMVVLVKPTDTSTYENLVNTLDELTITSVSRYVLAEYGDDDKAIIQGFTGEVPAGAQPAGS
jgi:biopolymer transport protein ExbD